MNSRYERKFCFNVSQLNLVEACLRSFNILEAYPQRSVFSIYYESHNFISFHDSNAGIGERLKRRIRWYNDKIDNLIFEKKIKNNELGYKINNFNQIPKSNNIETKVYYHGKFKYKIPIPKVWDICYVPVVGVSYDRKYFNVGGKDIRFTIDKNICFSKVVNYSSYSIVNYLLSQNSCVLEVKYDSQLETFPNNIMKKISLLTGSRYSRHSKFCNAIEERW